MKNCKLIIAVICLSVWLVNCASRRIKAGTVQKFSRTGEAIALDNLIQEYEREHKKFYEEYIKDGAYLHWPGLDNKNLSDYCKKYLHYCIPTRTTANTAGIKTVKSMHYQKQNAQFPIKVLVVQCKIMYKKFPVLYYMTRAPEPNCVYALKGTRQGLFLSNIINKQCNFENYPLTNNSIKRKRHESISGIHHETGQPMAKDIHLLEYELEHQELVKGERDAWPVNCAPRRIKTNDIQKFCRTGEAIAVDNLIHEYEKEHQKFYEEIKNGDYLKWPDFGNKNLSDYCKEYLEYLIPSRTTVNATGIKLVKPLYYENPPIISEIPVVRCKIAYKTQSVFYNMTRAPEPNCVYVLKGRGIGVMSKLYIINKHCDFEDNPSINSSFKRKRKEVIYRKHHETGQPIAKDKYLLEYELEHQEFFKKEKEGVTVDSGNILDTLILWPHILKHHNINAYCCQYMKKCVPSRKRKGVLGTWKTDILHYQKLNTHENISVTIVTCMPFHGSFRRYHITRAPDVNCVYALLRKDFKANNPFVIAFKHCDFEDPNDQQTISHDYHIPETNVIPKTEIKKEAVDIFVSQKIFPIN